jgi:hypothetical protein
MPIVYWLLSAMLSLGKHFPLLKLLNELIIIIISQFNNYKTLASVAEICRFWNEIFTEDSREIMRATIGHMYNKVQAAKMHKREELAKIYKQLKFAVSCCFLPRAHIEDALGQIWSIFPKCEAAELLLPLVRAVA